MEILYVVPAWFFATSIVLELIFAAVTLAVAYYSFKVYSLSGQRESKLFGVAFLIMAISFIIRSVLNIFVTNSINGDDMRTLTVGSIMVINNFSVYAYIFLMTISLMTLAYTTFKVNSSKIYSLLAITSILILVFAEIKAAAFYIMSILFLAYVVIHYYREYMDNRTKKKLQVLSAFVLLLISNVVFIKAGQNYLYFVTGHLLELASALLVLLSLASVIKYGQKKK